MVVGDRRPSAPGALDPDLDVNLIDPPDEGVLGGSEVGRIATAMQAFEERFSGAPVDRVVLEGSSDLALAAILVASKMRIPVAVIPIDAPSPAGNAPRALNRRLVEQLADIVLPDEATALAAWLATPQPPAPSRDEH
jgi:hypothetical protein